MTSLPGNTVQGAAAVVIPAQATDSTSLPIVRPDSIRR